MFNPDVEELGQETEEAFDPGNNLDLLFEEENLLSLNPKGKKRRRLNDDDSESVADASDAEISVATKIPEDMDWCVLCVTQMPRLQSYFDRIWAISCGGNQQQMLMLMHDLYKHTKECLLKRYDVCNYPDVGIEQLRLHYQTHTFSDLVRRRMLAADLTQMMRVIKDNMFTRTVGTEKLVCDKVYMHHYLGIIQRLDNLLKSIREDTKETLGVILNAFKKEHGSLPAQVSYAPVATRETTYSDDKDTDEETEDEDEEDDGMQLTSAERAYIISQHPAK